MWHDTEGIVHIWDKEPSTKEEKKFAEDLNQPNPDPAARATTAPPSPVAADQNGTASAQSADTVTSQATQETAGTAPAATEASPSSQTQPSHTENTTTEPPGDQPESEQNVVQPVPQRQRIIPQQQPQDMTGMTPEMQRQLQQQFQQQMQDQMQDIGPAVLLGMMGAALIPGLIIGLIFYLIAGYVLYRIGKKFGVGTFLRWLIPLYNLVLLTRCAGLSPWFAAPAIAQFGLVILLIPLMFVDMMFAMSLMTIAQVLNFIGYIAIAIIIGNIAKRLGKNLVLWVILALIPLVNLIAVLILAFDSSHPVLDSGSGDTAGGDEYPSLNMRRRGRGGKSSPVDEAPMLSAPPKAPKRKNPLDDEDDFPRRGAPPLKT